MDSAQRDRALVVTIGTRACAIPLQHVRETMRPLPVEAVAGTQAFISGVSVIRGEPVPVVDLRLLLGEPRARAGRFVTVRVGDRMIAIAVDDVLGMRALDIERELPPVLRDVRTEYIEAIATLDAQLLVVLRAARLVPEDSWAALPLASETR